MLKVLFKSEMVQITSLKKKPIRFIHVFFLGGGGVGMGVIEDLT